ncbi:MAG: ABC transporter permease [Clostridium sp.]|nr:ABC transporter permease [Clostridium sp.]
MNILTKYLLNSILKKKGKMILILFSITVSTALFVASLQISESITKSYINTLKGTYDNFNVSISANSKAKNPLFKASDFKTSGIEDNFKMATVNGYLKNNDSKTFNMIGTTLNDFKKFKSIKSLNLGSFSGNKIIISKKTSEALKLKLGDKVSLYTLGTTKEYIVSAIVSNNGLFLSDTSSNFVVVTPLNNVCSIYGEKDKYTSIYASVKDASENEWIKNFNNKNANFTAKLLVDESEVSSQTSIIKTCMLFMLCIVLIMSVFIIYSTFKIIIVERMSTFGTFLSTGATKLNIVMLLLRESFTYGFIGGVLGDLLSAGIIYIILNLTNPLKDDAIKVTVAFNYIYFVYGFILALVISIISSIIPILSIRKLPVKEVILNDFQISNKISIKSFIIGIVLMVVSIVFHFLGGSIKGQRPYITSLPAFFMGVTSVIIIIPKLVDIFLYPFVKLFRRVNSTLMLSTNNVRTSKILLNNIRLISVSVISIIMIISFNLALNDIITGVYRNLNYNLNVTINSDNANILKASNDIIENSSNHCTINKRQYIDTTLNTDSSKEIDVLCVEPKKFKSFDEYLTYNDKTKQLNELDSNDDGIIISKRIATRYNLKEGNKVTLYLDNKGETFKILSIIDAKFMNVGNVNLISYKSALKHFNIKYSNEFFISTNSSVSKLKETLSKKLKGLPVNISTKQDCIDIDQSNCKQIVELLSIFSYVTMIMGGVGIVSNIYLSFLQRKRAMAVLSSIGLTKGSRSFMILLESFIETLIGLIIGFILSGLIILLLGDIFKYLVLNINFIYPFHSIYFTALFTFLLTFITSLPALVKSKNLKIINQLKYE